MRFKIYFLFFIVLFIYNCQILSSQISSDVNGTFFFNGSDSLKINSKDIEPRNVLNNSKVNFSISAQNAESAWILITPPTGPTEIVKLINNGVVSYIVNKVGTYNVEFFANDSNSFVISSKDFFIVTSEPVVGNGSGGGGGNTGGCVYSLDCDSWSICKNDVQLRSCNKKSSCGNEKIAESRKCSEVLFNVLVDIKDFSARDNSLRTNVEIVNTLGIDNTDVQVNYFVHNSQDELIFNKTEIIFFNKNISYNKIFEGIEFAVGEYLFTIELIYGNGQKALVQESFVIEKTSATENRNILISVVFYIVIIMIVVLILITIKFIYNLESHKHYQ